MCFHQPCGVQIGAVDEITRLLNYLLSFHLATFTKAIQKICFCVLTELDVAEERKVERKTN